jgi:hypothetical protein
MQRRNPNSKIKYSQALNQYELTHVREELQIQIKFQVYYLFKN